EAGIGIQRELAGNAPVIESAAEAGDTAAAGMRRVADDYRVSSQRQYDAAEAGNLSLTADAVRGIKGDITARLERTNFPFDEKLHPAAWRAMSEIDRLATLPGAPTDAKILGMSLK